MTTCVALLHSIVLTARKRVVMADLRAMAEGLGLKNVRTLVSSGNMVFETEEESVSEIEAGLETAFEKTFGRFVPIVVRTAADWRCLVAANPFPAESAAAPDRVAVRVMREPLAADVVGTLRQVAAPDEKVEIAGGDPWIVFSRERPNSRLLAAINHKRLGTGTSRNWNTVRGLGDAARQITRGSRSRPSDR
jgi:uncharacterized protein (DUF1697 family)